MKKGIMNLVPENDEIRVGIFFPNYSYWGKVVQMIESELNDRGITDISVYYAEEDENIQAQQINNFIVGGNGSIGNEYLIVCSVDSSAIEAVIHEAVENAVNVIAFYNMIYNVNGIKYFIGIDYSEVARKQAQYIIDKLTNMCLEYAEIPIMYCPADPIDSLMYEVAKTYFKEQGFDYIEMALDNHSRTEAYEAIMGLTGGDELVAINCVCDEYATGVIMALQELGYASMPIITGFGGTDEARQNIANGLQSMTISNDFGELASQVAEIIVAIYSGEELGGEIIENGQGGIPGSIIVTGILEDDVIPPPLDDKVLDYIEIESLPNKTEYYKYESFNPRGMSVRAYFTDGTSILAWRYICSPAIFLSLSDTTVTVSFTHGDRTRETSFKIKVLDRSADSIKVYKTKSNYFDGDIVNKDLFNVEVIYDKGNSRYATNYTIISSPVLIEGNNLITIQYEEDGDSFEETITICAYRKLKSIELASKPRKRSYYKGERFDRTGMTVIARYSNGESDIISSGNLYIDPKIVKFKDGEEKTDLTVTYIERGVSATTTITVYKKTGIDLDDCDITQDMGSSGRGVINLSTGKLTYKLNDFLGNDAIFPICISHVYKNEIGNSFGMGNNWRLNLQQEVENDGKWKYTDKEGKVHFFDDGYEEKDERSSVRNEKLGLDLFENKENSTIVLKDRNNNTLVFSKINSVYKLTAIHLFPSKPENPLDPYSMTIGYSENGKIDVVTAGQAIEGNRPKVRFVYSQQGNLNELRYACGEETVVAKYEYNNENLDKITLCHGNTDAQYESSTSFAYGDKSFTIHDLSSKNKNGIYKTLIYSMDEEYYRVNEYSIGYSDEEKEITKISYSAKEVSQEETSDISMSCKVESKGTVNIYSFNNMGVVSQFSYEIEDGNYLKPVKCNDSQSRGFNYKSLASTYSDKLDVVHDDFENGVNDWNNAESVSDRAISGSNCISGSSLSKRFTLTSNDIQDDTTLYMSLWVMNGSRITVKIESGEATGEVKYNFDNNLINKWQYTALCLGKRKIGDKIIVRFSGGETYIDDVRITKMPYETPEEITDTEYDSYGNVTKAYQYNPIGKYEEVTEYTYNSDHQIINQIQKGGTLKSCSETTYENGLPKSKKEYGCFLIYTEGCNIYTDNILTSSYDVNNVKTSYNNGKDFSETTIIGETSSPDNKLKNYFYKNSGVIETVVSGMSQNLFTYRKDGNIDTIKFNYNDPDYSSQYAFEYDTFGNLSALKIGNISFVTMEYDYRHLNKTIYANKDYLTYKYDEKDRVVEIYENSNLFVSMEYSNNDTDLVTVTHTGGLCYTSQAVNKNGITSEYCVQFGNINRSLKVKGYAANETGNITSVGYFIDNGTDRFEKTTFEKDDNGLLKKLMRTYHGASIEYTYDNLYRQKIKKTNYATTTYKSTYNYNTISGNRKGTHIMSETHKAGTNETNYSYNYYKNGNLSKIFLDSSLQNEYKYDEYGRLIWEYNYAFSEAYQFSYDNGGNITEKKTFNITGGNVSSLKKTDIYDYETATPNCGQNADWKDQLKSYNNQPITYDELGNPLNYLGKVITWRGRKLMSIGGVVMDYDYNGLRVKKGDKTFYWFNGNLILERWGNNSENYIYYYYDESGVCGMNYNGNEYYFRRNILGDILAIYDSAGNLQCRYVYDAWGNHKIYGSNGAELSAVDLNVGNTNPFRYRGYYWDKEFSLYYLKSRYYDPALGRFISADDVSYLNPQTIQGLNLYAYCENNPVMGVDPDGTSFIVFLVGALIGFGVSFASSVASQAAFNEGKIDFGVAAIDGLFGSLSGALWMVPGLGPWATGFINAGLTAINGVITTGMENNWQYTLQDGFSIAASSILSGVVSGATRNQFFKAKGQSILTDTHKLVGTIEQRIVSGRYNDGVHIFSKSFKSAAGQMFGNLAKLNFGRGFYVDWLITGLQAMFSTTFSRGVKSLVW